MPTIPSPASILRPAIHLPAVNMNGDTKATLVGQWVDVMDAANVLIRVLRRAAPHGRNFQTLGAGELDMALAQHRERLEAVDTLAMEAGAMAEAIDQQGGR